MGLQASAGDGDRRQDRRGDAQAAGYAHDYHRRVLEGVLRRADQFRERSRSPFRNLAPDGTSDTGRTHPIKQRIVENARRRLQIAAAMKAEAGVKAHELTGQGDGGIAWSDRAKILAPVGENMLQLATLAHECGHVFLHADGSPGRCLPGHVKEMEAESYAHQAFRAHGMRMPNRITKWGRAYVGNWVEADRAEGITIDPRAEAYAAGLWSPYEPLREVPPTWPQAGVWRRLQYKVSRRYPGLTRTIGSLAAESAALLATAFWWFVAGYAAGLMLGTGIWPELMPRFDVYDIGHRINVCFPMGLIGACLGVMWRTATRPPGGRVEQAA